MNQIDLHHIALCCHEKQSLSVFYDEILDARLVKTFQVSPELFFDIFEQKESAEVFVYETDQLRFEIFLMEKSIDRGSAHVCLEVPDKKAFAEQCSRHQIPVKWVKKNDKRLLFVADFSGNLFEIKEKQ